MLSFLCKLIAVRSAKCCQRFSCTRLLTFVKKTIESKVSWITKRISRRWKAQCRGHEGCKILAAWQIRMQSRFLWFESFDQQCFIFDRTFQISMNVLSKAIPVEILNSECWNTEGSFKCPCAFRYVSNDRGQCEGKHSPSYNISIAF